MTHQLPARETRVLQVVLSLNPGGTERLVLEIIGRLHAEIPMAVCCLDEVGAWGQELAGRGIAVRSLRRSPGFSPSLGRGVADAVKAHRATIVHAHQYTPFVYSCFSRWWQKDAPIVFTEHGRLSDAAPSGKRRLVNQFLRRIPAATFAVSHDLQRFMAVEGFQSDGVQVIYNGIEIGPLPDADDRRSVRAELRASDDEVLIGSVARLDPVKSLDTLLQALPEIARRRPAGIVIVGDGPERTRLEAIADELGMRSRVRFLGQRDDARRWLAGCDVYVNSSTSEGVSLTILEAMAACLPVVATRVGGTPEVVTPDCGVLVPARDVAALAAAILSLTESPDRAHALGRAARARVEAQFTIERMVEQYANIYRSLG